MPPPVPISTRHRVLLEVNSSTTPNSLSSSSTDGGSTGLAATAARAVGGAIVRETVPQHRDACAGAAAADNEDGLCGAEETLAGKGVEVEAASEDPARPTAMSEPPRASAAEHGPTVSKRTEEAMPPAAVAAGTSDLQITGGDRVWALS